MCYGISMPGWVRVGATVHGAVYHGPDLYKVVARAEGWMLRREGLEMAGHRFVGRLTCDEWGPFGEPREAFAKAEELRLEGRKAG